MPDELGRKKLEAARGELDWTSRSSLEVDCDKGIATFGSIILRRNPEDHTEWTFTLNGTKSTIWIKSPEELQSRFKQKLADAQDDLGMGGYDLG